MTEPMKIARQNLKKRLGDNPYPGRGLILGLDESGDRLVQAYWIMGRSENSRNRVFAYDDVRVWTEAADPSKVKDPSLIIYTALDELTDVFVVTNGNQTDTICSLLANGGTFEQALGTREHEPDAPNYTPRISGMFDVRVGKVIGKIGVLRRSTFSGATDRCYWHYEGFAPGLGFCVTTYMGDGDPLPAFVGDPYLLPLKGDTDDIASSIWDNLNEDNRVSLCVKTIDPAACETDLKVINKYTSAA